MNHSQNQTLHLFQSFTNPGKRFSFPPIFSSLVNNNPHLLKTSVKIKLNLNRCLYTNIHNIIQNSKKVETTQMSIYG